MLLSLATPTRRLGDTVPRSLAVMALRSSSTGPATTILHQSISADPLATELSTAADRQALFANKLSQGPSFSDFVSGGSPSTQLSPSEALELKEVPSLSRLNNKKQ